MFFSAVTRFAKEQRTADGQSPFVTFRDPCSASRILFNLYNILSTVVLSVKRRINNYQRSFLERGANKISWATIGNTPETGSKTPDDGEFAPVTAQIEQEEQRAHSARPRAQYRGVYARSRQNYIGDCENRRVADGISGTDGDIARSARRSARRFFVFLFRRGAFLSNNGKAASYSRRKKVFTLTDPTDAEQERKTTAARSCLWNTSARTLKAVAERRVFRAA